MLLCGYDTQRQKKKKLKELIATPKLIASGYAGVIILFIIINEETKKT